MSDRRKYLYLGKMMENRGMKAEELASTSGVAYNTALSYQRDASERLSKDVLGRIAVALGVDVWELFLPCEDREKLNALALKHGVSDPASMSGSELLNALADVPVG